MAHGGPHGLLDRLGGGLATLFGGRSDPNLSEEANRRATSDALVTSGLATLLSERPGGGARTPIQTLAEGIIAGRGAGAATREAESEKQQLAQLKTAIDDQGLDSRDLFLRALQIGDLDSATQLGALARADAAATGRVERNVRTIEATGPEGPGIYVLNSDGTLGAKSADLKPRGSAGQRFSNQKTYISETTGERFVGVHDAEANDGAGGIVRVEGVRPDTTATERSQQELGKVGLVAQQALEPLNRELASITTDIISKGGILASTVANFIATDRQQIALALADTFLNVTVRWLSGAQMTDQERTNYKNAMLPRAGEGEFTTRVKIEMQRAIATAMSAGVWQGQPTVDGDGNEIGDADNVAAWTAQAQVEAIQKVIAEMEAEAGGFSGGGGPSLQDIIDTGRIR